MNFCISPLSANMQCNTLQDAFRIIKNLVDCFEHLLPAIGAKKINLIYDEKIEQRQLIADQPLISTINNLPNDSSDRADLKKLWFTYTKNRAQAANLDVIQEVQIFAIGTTIRLTEELHLDFLQQGVNWLSLGGSSFSESLEYETSYIGKPDLRIRNAHDLVSLKCLLPRYEPSAKHGHKPYIDKSGEYVSPMPLGKEEASLLLLIATPDKGDLFAYHQSSGSYYRYKPTHIDQNIYHGFQVDEESIPPELRQVLKN